MVQSKLRTPLPSPVELITKKRDGHALDAQEIAGLVSGYLAEKITDYQMSAWLMAAFLRGMTPSETLALTRAMLESGDVLELKSVKLPKVDKHSTGGVGDKVSLCLGPSVAACGVAVPMISGRGLGHTGGTLDKLEAIPGYQTRLDPHRFERVVREVGVSIIGQSERLAPADRRIYALRDVTGTVESIPLIVASILSKKLAAGLDGLVLDVKTGRGAFMPDVDSARALGRALVQVAEAAGMPVTALLTRMDAPIGRTVGNALETREAIEVLGGEGPADTRELTLELGVEMLLLARAFKRREPARKSLERALASGAALERFRRMVEAHGGDPRVIDQPARLPRAPRRLPVLAPRSGVVTAIDARELGWVSVLLGAGRTRADQKVDPAVGIELLVRPGQQVEAREPLAFLHVRRSADGARQLARTLGAFRLGSKRPKEAPLILERVRGG
jgi:pyrimidine-nucleoside phosphorylase